MLLELATLFGVSFLAATILPAQSELVLAGLQAAGNVPAVWLLIAASSGNILGAVVSYILGVYITHFKNRSWFPVNEKQLEKANLLFTKWGSWSLLFAWVPFIGDALTVAAGILRVNFWLFLLLMSVGKIARYVAVIYVVSI